MKGLQSTHKQQPHTIDILNEAGKEMGNENLYQKIDSFWKMLDDMAENNQEEYRKFISSQIKQGMGEIAKTQKISSAPAFCFKLKAVKAQAGGKVQELVNEDKVDAILYLNICYADAVLPPLTENNELADPMNDATWKLIPFSFSKKVEASSGATKKIFIDMHVSTAVYTLFMKKPT